jgi:hypothetical protein
MSERIIGEREFTDGVTRPVFERWAADPSVSAAYLPRARSPRAANEARGKVPPR